MAGGAILEVSGLSKRYCRDFRRSMRYGTADIMREFLPAVRKEPELRRGEFWAVDDISFAINRGEAVAIAGRNGAGKTTLMRLLAGIIKPDKGEIRLHGRANPVIELGQGLNPLLTGRENAALGLAWRGAVHDVIGPLVEEIDAFSELGENFEKPINQYSAGMRVRLAFAIAAHVPAELLVLDEVLSVGDLAFQHKCMRKMRQHIDQGGSLVLVSHNAFQMQAICRRGLLIEDGRITFDGGIEQCIDRVLNMQLPVVNSVASTPGRSADAPEIVQVHLSAGQPETPLAPGDDLVIDIEYKVNTRCDALFCAGIWSADGSLCLAQLPESGPVSLPAGTGRRRCHIPKLPLAQGRYGLRIILIEPATMLSLVHVGYDTPPVALVVEEEISRFAVLAREAGQILKLQSHWSDIDSDAGIKDKEGAGHVAR